MREPYAEYLKIEFESNIKVKKHIKIKKSSEKRFKTMRQIKYQEGVATIIRKLERRLNLPGENTERDSREFILYFLGYLYYKSNDIFKAKEKPEECIKLESRTMKVWEFIGSGLWQEEFCRFVNSGQKWSKFQRFFTAKSTTERYARELLDYFWKYKINCPWWNWWWSSPVHRWLKRVVFILLLYPFLSFILYSFIPDLAVFIPELIPFINENRFAYILLISAFFLLSPSIYRIKVEEIEVELRSPPPPLEPMLSLENLFLSQNL